MKQKGNLLDTLFYSITGIFALSVLVIMACICVSLFIGSIPAIKHFGLHFLFNSTWNPNNDEFGAAVSIIGTLLTTLIAAIIGIPLSFGIAVFLTQICPHTIKNPLCVAVELLAGIPSIVYGIWGLFVFAPYFADHIAPFLTHTFGLVPYIGALVQGTSFGVGILPAGFILALMIIPFITSVMRDVFDIVPKELKESASALGATTWEVVWHVILPYTKIGVTGGIMLGLGRALGETMAVAFVIGNSHQLSISLLQPGSTISSLLANEFPEAQGVLYSSALVELGLILFLITTLVLTLAKFLLIRLAKREGKKRGI